MSVETAVGLAVVWPLLGIVLIALLRRWPNDPQIPLFMWSPVPTDWILMIGK